MEQKCFDTLLKGHLVEDIYYSFFFLNPLNLNSWTFSLCFYFHARQPNPKLLWHSQARQMRRPPALTWQNQYPTVTILALLEPWILLSSGLGCKSLFDQPYATSSRTTLGWSHNNETSKWCLKYHLLFTDDNLKYQTMSPAFLVTLHTTFCPVTPVCWVLWILEGSLNQGHLQLVNLNLLKKQMECQAPLGHIINCFSEQY